MLSFHLLKIDTCLKTNCALKEGDPFLSEWLSQTAFITILPHDFFQHIKRNRSRMENVNNTFEGSPIILIQKASHFMIHSCIFWAHKWLSCTSSKSLSVSTFFCALNSNWRLSCLNGACVSFGTCYFIPVAIFRVWLKHSRDTLREQVDLPCGISV